MRKTIAAAIVSSCIAGLLFSATAYSGKLVNGKAVSVQWRYGLKDWAAMTCESGNELRDGAILLYTVQNSLVAHCDTIHPRSNGLAQYPSFNLAGTKIAFYRLGKAPATTGSGCVSVDGGTTHISVINPDGTGLTDLCELPAEPIGGMFPLDWPAGDWIYYEMPHLNVLDGNQGNSSVMIWRVNAATKVNEKVCNFTSDGSGAELTCAYIHRMTIAQKGDYMALMTYPKNACANDPAASIQFFSHVNNVYRFPPANCNLGASSVTGRPGCNASISPSGRIMGNYFAGNHDDMQITTVVNDPGVGLVVSADNVCHVWLNTNNDPNCPICQQSSQENLTKWNGGVNIGIGAECIRWSANSDKWVGQCVGFVNSGHAGDQVLGSNQVLCNWVDKVAINVSKNPKVTGGDVNGQGVIYWNNCTGDFWVDDPVNNPARNKYEDLKGAWQDIPGAPATSIGAGIHYRSPANSGSGIQLIGHRDLLIRQPADAVSELSIADLRGVTIARYAVRGTGAVSLNAIPAGSYMAILKSHGISLSTKLIVR
jgi:hypothetical protein